MVAVILLVLVVVHAVLALRKLPGSYAQYRALSQQAALIRHSDTSLWRWQALTGFALFFLVAPHLLLVMLQPAAIGAEASARRIVGDLAVFYYLVFLPVVIVHAAFGTYRVLLKWGHPPIHGAAGAHARGASRGSSASRISCWDWPRWPPTCDSDWRCPDEGHHHRRARHWRRPGRPARGHRRAPPRP